MPGPLTQGQISLPEPSHDQTNPKQTIIRKQALVLPRRLYYAGGHTMPGTGFA